MVSLINNEPRGDGLDPEIVVVLKYLNRFGYRTIGSCAGHGKKYNGGNGFNRGEITIDRTPSKYKIGFDSKGKIASINNKDVNDIIIILKNHGLKSIKFKKPATFTFTSVGKVNK
jgi:hypothetical protein